MLVSAFFLTANSPLSTVFTPDFFWTEWKKYQNSWLVRLVWKWEFTAPPFWGLCWGWYLMNLFVLRVPGIVVRKGNGQFPQFFKWNDITNLVNHKRYFGVECQSYDRSAQVRPPTTQFLFCLLFVKKIVDMPGVDDPCLGRILTLHSVIFVSVRPMMVFLSGHGAHQGPSTLPCPLLSELQS